MDKKDCLYCENKEKLDSLMLPICELGVSTLYLFREQAYYGRCVVAYKDHARELVELDKEETALLWEDVKRASRAISKVVNPAKVNYGMYSDTLPHLHVHLVPKQKDGYGFGGTFEMNVEPPRYLSDAEYDELAARLRAEL